MLCGDGNSCAVFVAGPPGDMECTGGELSDSGSSGYWSWDHGNVSPAPSPSVTEMDSSPDEGLHMEPEQWEELTGRKSKVGTDGSEGLFDRERERERERLHGPSRQSSLDRKSVV